jgi:hypothetical protein
VLADDPLGIPRLDFGDQVKFKREHIIDILWEPSQVRESELAAGDQEHHNIAPVHEGATGTVIRDILSCPHRQRRSKAPDLPPFQDITSPMLARDLRDLRLA